VQQISFKLGSVDRPWDRYISLKRTVGAFPVHRTWASLPPVVTNFTKASATASTLYRTICVIFKKALKKHNHLGIRITVREKTNRKTMKILKARKKNIRRNDRMRNFNVQKGNEKK
jgi:hypothetical protein